MAGLVEADLVDSRYLEIDDAAPSLIADRLGQCLARRGIGRVHAELGRWEGEGQPSAPGIDELEVEHVAEERRHMRRTNRGQILNSSTDARFQDLTPSCGPAEDPRRGGPRRA